MKTIIQRIEEKAEVISRRYKADDIEHHKIYGYKVVWDDTIKG